VYRSKFVRYNIKVDREYKEVRKICVRPGEIVQVLSNVISNAVDAMPEGGKLSISIIPSAASVEAGVDVRVTDTGHGIRREHLARVFEPFYTTKGNLGTGIGLWVGKELVERHGGQISVSSKTEPGDSGTVVSIFLPFSRTKMGPGKIKEDQSRTENQ
jgi:signal transduction histidine kinase